MLAALAVIVLVIGATSCFQMLIVTRTDGHAVERSISIARGAVYYVQEDRSRQHAPPLAGWSSERMSVFGPPVVQLAPKYHREFGSTPMPTTSVCVPLWMPLIAAAGPAGWMWWMSRRDEVKRCEGCGYDLAGLPAGRCPECGEETRPAPGA